MAKRGMKERIAEIRAENAAKCDMSKEEYRSYLIGAMQTPAAEIQWLVGGFEDPSHAAGVIAWSVGNLQCNADAAR